MNYKHKETRANSDDTFNFDIVGEYPVKFVDFFKCMLEHSNSFRIQFGASNQCYGGWLGNRLEVHKINDEWYWERQKPENWFEEIKDKNVVKCWANGGWGQMTYFCTFEEE